MNKIATSILAAVFTAALSGTALAQGVGQLGTFQIWGNPTSGGNLGRPSNIGSFLTGGTGITISGTPKATIALTAIITAGGPTGSSSVVPVITYNAQGQITAVTTATITPAAIGGVPSTRNIATTSPLSGGGDLSADRTFSIATNGIDNTLIRQGVARSVIGVTGNATANVADIQGAASQFFGVNAAGTVLGFQTMIGDATLSGPTISIGATKVTSAMLNADVFSTAHSWGGQQTFTAPILGVATGTSLALGVGLSGGSSVSVSGNIDIGAAAAFYWGGRSQIQSPSDGVIKLANNANTDFGRLQFGGTTSSFPSIKRSGAALAFRLADESADAGLTAGATTLSAALTYGGVTLSNAVTGTGNMVLSTSPTIASPTFSGTVAGAGTHPLSVLATQATNTVVGNATSGTASPTALAVGTCSTAASALIWTTNTGFGCNTSITAAAVPVGGITGLGTGVATALGVNVGSAGAFVTFNGALGTPSSGTLTNATGLPLSTGVTGTLLAAQFPALTGDVTNSAGALATTIANNAVTNAKSAQMAANTIKGNVTGSTANATDFTIDGLTNKASPAAGDEVILWDVAGAAVKKTTVSALSSAGSVASIGGNTGAFTLNHGITNATNEIDSIVPVFQHRITLTSNTPVMTSSVSAGTTVYVTPYKGTFTTLYDGTNLLPTSTAEISIALGSNWTTNSNWDVYVGLDSGTLRACTGPAWTSDTARGSGALTTEIERVSGVWLNKNSMTCRYNNTTTFTCAADRCSYLGTFRTGSAGQANYILGGSASGGTAGNLGVWNLYNRVWVLTQVIDSGTSYTYTTNTVRQARASAGNQISFLTGLQEDGINCLYVGEGLPTGGANVLFGIGFDATNSFSSQFAVVAVNAGTGTVTYASVGALGYHYCAATEEGDGSHASTFDGGSANSLSITLMQ